MTFYQKVDASKPSQVLAKQVITEALEMINMSLRCGNPNYNNNNNNNLDEDNDSGIPAMTHLFTIDGT